MSKGIHTNRLAFSSNQVCLRGDAGCLMCIWMWGYAFVLEVREVTESYLCTLFILHTYVGGERERNICVQLFSIELEQE